MDFQTEQVSSKMKTEFKAIFGALNSCTDLNRENYLDRYQLYYNMKNGQHELNIQVNDLIPIQPFIRGLGIKLKYTLLGVLKLTNV